MSKYVLLFAALFAISSVIAEDKVTVAKTEIKYECAKISKDDADRYYKEGHDYLDYDKNKIPCDEVAVKQTPPQQPKQAAPVAPPVVVTLPSVKAPDVSIKTKNKRKGGKCRTVKGYTKKNGTKVNGYTRCK